MIDTHNIKSYVIIFILICKAGLDIMSGQVNIDTINVDKIRNFKSDNSGMNFPILIYKEKMLNEINMDIREDILENGNFLNEHNLEMKTLLDSFYNAGVGLCYEIYCDNNMISLEFHGQNDWGIYNFYNYSLLSQKQLSLFDLVGCEGVVSINDSISDLRLMERDRINVHFDSIITVSERDIYIHYHMPVRNSVLESIGFGRIYGYIINDSALVICLDTWHQNFEPVEKFPLTFDKKMIILNK